MCCDLSVVPNDAFPAKGAEWGCSIFHHLRIHLSFWVMLSIIFWQAVTKAVGSKCSAVCFSGLLMNLTAKIFQLERSSSLFLGSQISNRQGGAKGSFLVDLCIGIKFGQNPTFFTSPEFWMTRAWWLPLNWVPSPSPALWVSIPVECKWENKEASCGDPIL